MLKGSGKIKVSGALLTGSSLFLLVYMIYAAAMMGSRTNVFSSSDSAIAAMLFIIGYHLYKLIIGIVAIKKANTPDCRGVVANGIVLTILSVFWIIICGAALNSAATRGGGEALLTVFLLLAILDLIMMILMLVGVTQNKPTVGAMPLTPFNYDRLWTNPNGQQNPYGQPNQFGQANQFGQPMQNADPSTQFGAQNTQFGAAPAAQAVQNEQASTTEQGGEKPRKIYSNQDYFVDPRTTYFGQFGGGFAQGGQFGGQPNGFGQQCGYGAPQMPQMPYMQGNGQPMQPQMPPMNDTRQ